MLEALTPFKLTTCCYGSVTSIFTVTLHLTPLSGHRTSVYVALNGNTNL